MIHSGEERECAKWEVKQNDAKHVQEKTSREANLWEIQIDHLVFPSNYKLNCELRHFVPWGPLFNNLYFLWKWKHFSEQVNFWRKKKDPVPLHCLWNTRKYTASLRVMCLTVVIHWAVLAVEWRGVWLVLWWREKNRNYSIRLLTLCWIEAWSGSIFFSWQLIFSVSSF